MNVERMPKSLAIYVLSMLAIGAVAIWSILNGHEDAYLIGLLVLVCILGLIAAVGICYLIFEAIRSLFGFRS
jgi:hypothetical protein